MASARQTECRDTDSLSRGCSQSLLRWSEEARGPEKENGRNMKLVPSGDRLANRGDDYPVSATRQPSVGRMRMSDRRLRKCSKSDAGQRRDRRQPGRILSHHCLGPVARMLSTTSPENPQGERGQTRQPAGWPARITRPRNRSACFF